MSYRLLPVAAFVLLMLVVLACGSGDTQDGLEETSAPPPTAAPDPACAGGSGAAYAELLRRVSWTFYCPSFLPEGAVLEDSDFTFIAGQGTSTLTFRLADERKIEIVQGIVGITPRDDRDLPIVDPVRAVSFGDVAAELFDTKVDVPLVLSTEASEVTRVVVGSSGLDPEVVVAVAEGMHSLE